MKNGGRLELMVEVFGLLSENILHGSDGESLGDRN